MGSSHDVEWKREQEEASQVKKKSQPRLMSEAVNPSYYSRWKIQPIEFIQQNNLDYMRGNIIKYIMRYDAKNGLADLFKAKEYLKHLIEHTVKKGIDDNG